MNNSLKSNLSRLIGPPKDYALSQFFRNGQNDSMYGKLYKNNMDGLNSFFTNSKGLEHIVKSEKVAFIQHGDLINFYKDYHCKVGKTN